MENPEQNIKYLQAKKRVKRIKGFYIHLTVFIAVHVMIAIGKFFHNEDLNPEDFLGSGLWAIGLAIHGLSVFMPAFIFSKDWEERKIRELLEKNKNLKP